MCVSWSINLTDVFLAAEQHYRFHLLQFPSNTTVYTWLNYGKKYYFFAWGEVVGDVLFDLPFPKRGEVLVKGNVSMGSME
jgi:hypothetical protein